MELRLYDQSLTKDAQMSLILLPFKWNEYYPYNSATVIKKFFEYEDPLRFTLRYIADLCRDVSRILTYITHTLYFAIRQQLQSFLTG